MSLSFLRQGTLLCLLAFAGALAAQDTTVVLLRHAERQSILDGDSPLAEVGLRRAEALVPLLEAFLPEALYTSDLIRTQQTLAPLSAKLRLKPSVWSKEASGGLSEAILRNHRGHTVIVCWHHDLMKKVARGLGVKGAIPYWSLDAYDRLWIVRVPAKGEATLEERPQSLAPAGAGMSQR